MYIPAVVAVAEHFHRRQSLAMGICVCGTGVGTFLLAPAELYLLNRSDTCDMWQVITSSLLGLAGAGPWLPWLGCVCCAWAQVPSWGPRPHHRGDWPVHSPGDCHKLQGIGSGFIRHQYLKI